MKKSIFTIIGLILIGHFSFAQIENSETSVKNQSKGKVSERPVNCSPSTSVFLANYKNNHLSQNSKKCLRSNSLDEQTISLFLKVNESFDTNELKSLNFQVNSKSGNIISATIPVNNLDKLFSNSGIEYIEVAAKVTTKLDEALKDTKVGFIHNGTNLSQAYTGKDVIVGIVDGGFDFTHPNFYDDDSKYRIVRVWDQNFDFRPPEDFGYGAELKKKKQILDYEYDIKNESHGTHVAGIAAGNGVNTNYRGIAYNSELVLVSYGYTNTNIADGINYVFKYAESVSKPAVVNLSLGYHEGPHDGTSLFDQYCDSLVGKGKIIVGAAGNEGGDSLHLDYSFSTTDSVVSSAIDFWGWPDGETFIDMWGEKGNDFSIEIALMNYYNHKKEDSTIKIYTSSNDNFYFKLVDYDNDTCYVMISTENSNLLNGKPHIYVYVDNTEQTRYDQNVVISIFGTDGKIDAWCSEYASFKSFGINGLTDGNTNSTVGELGGTGKSIISVGAYTTKNEYTNLSGKTKDIYFPADIGEIAPFSSHGPTADGRMKPDISAPGNEVISSVNSFDKNYKKSSREVVEKVDGDYYFGSMGGTSMSSPVVTGIIALMLEAKPDLTPDDIKDFFKNNSSTDNFTGSTPNNTWGYGKINAYDAIKAVEGTTSIVNHSENNLFYIYPNPSNGIFTLHNNDYSINTIQITDVSGKIVYRKKYETWEGPINIDLSNLSKGVYFINLIGEENSKQSKILISN